VRSLPIVHVFSAVVSEHVTRIIGIYLTNGACKLNMYIVQLMKQLTV